MSSINTSAAVLADLAMEAEMKDPIDWAMLSIEERQAYTLMATSVLEQIGSLPADQQLTVALATMTKLLVENFVLNVKLQGQ